MFASKVVVVIALALLGIANAQVLFGGPCSANVNVVPNFNVEKYLGTWYEYAKFPTYFEQDGKCVTAQYSLQADGNVAVNNSMVNATDGAPMDILGYAKIIANAKLLVTFPVSPAYNASSNYWVLDTDYENYSVVYSCQPLSNNEHSITAWILTRQRKPCSDLIIKAQSVLLNNNVPLSNLIITDQAGCN